MRTLQPDARIVPHSAVLVSICDLRRSHGSCACNVFVGSRGGAKRKSKSSAYVCLSPVLALSLLLVSQEINPSTLSPPCNFSYERELHQ